jgi:probable F420-dependent oxidoreductase
VGIAVERAGFRRLWSSSPPADLGPLEEILAATSTLAVASGIVNIWRVDAREVAGSFHRLNDRYPCRFLLGIGVGHPEANTDYTRPIAAIESYLDILDAEGVPTSRRVLAALGPRMLRLAGERTAGAHPYLVPTTHTAIARDLLGPGPLLIPEHKVVLEADPERARAIGRPTVRTPYLDRVNYLANLRRLGYADAELADGGSDRLIDAVVAHGPMDAVVDQLAAHLDAGADEVAIQVLAATDAELVPSLESLGAALRAYEATRSIAVQPS